jgi:response regulator RpfG family c-di-GMP phosphodiesterase
LALLARLGKKNADLLYSASPMHDIGKVGIPDNILKKPEKWNGSGYPNGLCGSKIHIFGRITAVADVFDALGSVRCYKKA